jgi:hypothetical protein
MSGSAAALPKNKNKGHPMSNPDFMPDLRRQSSSEESVGCGEEDKKKKKKQQKKGPADIGSSQSGSTEKKPKKKNPVGIRLLYASLRADELTIAGRILNVLLLDGPRSIGEERAQVCRFCLVMRPPQSARAVRIWQGILMVCRIYCICLGESFA